MLIVRWVEMMKHMKQEEDMRISLDCGLPFL